MSSAINMSLTNELRRLLLLLMIFLVTTLPTPTTTSTAATVAATGDSRTVASAAKIASATAKTTKTTTTTRTSAVNGHARMRTQLPEYQQQQQQQLKHKQQQQQQQQLRRNLQSQHINSLAFANQAAVVVASAGTEAHLTHAHAADSPSHSHSYGYAATLGHDQPYGSRGTYSRRPAAQQQHIDPNIDRPDYNALEEQMLEEEATYPPPVFDFGMPRNITARSGQTAAINCRVEHLGDKSVSWIRKRDLHILTAGILTYTSDERFKVVRTADSKDWTLHVKYAQPRDSGIYECQVNTEPKISMAFRLNVIVTPPDAKAIITGPADLYVKVGSAITLTCHVKQPSSASDIGPIYWYRGPYILTPFVAHPNEAAIDLQRISMESKLGDKLQSRLRIANAQTADSGNYTCMPTTADAASVVVNVINDESPAAMQKSAACSVHSSSTLIAMVASAVRWLCHELYHDQQQQPHQHSSLQRERQQPAASSWLPHATKAKPPQQSPPPPQHRQAAAHPLQHIAAILRHMLSAHVAPS